MGVIRQLISTGDFEGGMNQRTDRSAGKTIADSIYELLSDAIVKGKLQPGQRLQQQDLALQYKTSIIPVREALQRLDMIGLVRIIPYRGAVVADLSKQDVADVYLIRSILEPAAVRLAVPRLTADDIARLKQLLEQMESPDLAHQQWLDYNKEFRLTIYRASGSKRLVRMISELFNATQHYRRMLQLLAGWHEDSMKRNRVLVQACEQGDVERVEAVISDGIRAVQDGFSELLDGRQTYGSG